MTGESALRQALALMGALIIAACSPGSGRGLDESGRPIGETPDPGDLPTLANIQARVFTPICIVCHVGAAAPRGLRLDATNAFGDLVGVSSQEVGGLLRVNPFNPDDSYLVQKIEGTASVGAQMPFGGPPLPAENILLIRQWITEGAMDTPTAPAGQSKVRSVDVGATSIRVEFTRELDASTVHISSVTLTRSDNIVVDTYSVAIAELNSKAILIRMPDAASKDISYRLELNTGNVASVLDMSGRPVEPYRLEFR